MRIDLDCPVELWRLELPKADHHACDLILFHLGAKVITSAEVQLVLYDGDGQETRRISWRAHDLNAVPGKTFSFSVPLEADDRPAQAEVIFNKLWYDDNSLWRAERGALREYTSNHLPAGRELNFLRATAGKTAVGYPREEDGLWICVCGRPNREGEATCVRCHREKQTVFAQYTREALEKRAAEQEKELKEKTRQAQAKSSERQAEREQVYRSRKKQFRRRAALVCALILLAGIACAGYFVGLPYLRYTRAVTAMQEGRYAQAREAFEAMPGYRDADAKAREALFLQAKADLESGDIDALRAACDTLSGLTENAEAQALTSEASYRLAGALLADGQAQEARELYAALGEYKEAASQIQACDYAIAAALMAEGEDADALAAFEALGDYADSADQLPVLHLRLGQSALKKEQLDEAITHLEAAGESEEAAALLQEAHYQKGTGYLQASLYEEAGQEFLLAGDYADAKELGSECLYGIAGQHMADGDWVEAATLFGQIADYKDSADRQTEAQWRNALTLQRDQEYNAALAALDLLPEGAEGPDRQTADEVRSQIRYAQALQALDREDPDAAETLFALIPGYEDADSRLASLRLQRAERLTEEADYAAAIELLESLEQDKHTAALLQSARYARAEQLLDEGDWQGAETLSALLDEKEQNTLREPIDYQRAAALEAEGKTEEAAALYLSLGDYTDAAEQAGRIYYGLGADAAGTDPLAAANWYLKAGEYGDAAEQAAAMYDAVYGESARAAQAAYDSGDYARCVEVLSGMDLTALPEAYAALPGLWQDANEAEGCRLMDAGQPYEALPYFRAVPALRSVVRRMQNKVYLILGVWEDREGNTYQFREDYTCTLNDEELCFALSEYDLQTGAEPGALSVTHRVSTLTEQYMVLRDMRGDKVISISLRKLSDDSAPLPRGLATPADLPVLENSP